MSVGGQSSYSNQGAGWPGVSWHLPALSRLLAIYCRAFAAAIAGQGTREIRAPRQQAALSCLQAVDQLLKLVKGGRLAQPAEAPAAAAHVWLAGAVHTGQSGWQPRTRARVQGQTPDCTARPAPCGAHLPNSVARRSECACCAVSPGVLAIGLGTMLLVATGGDMGAAVSCCAASAAPSNTSSRCSASNSCFRSSRARCPRCRSSSDFLSCRLCRCAGGLAQQLVLRQPWVAHVALRRRRAGQGKTHPPDHTCPLHT